MQSWILDLAGGDPDKITAKIVLDAAKAGDEVGTECFENYGRQLTNSFANVIDLIDPHTYDRRRGRANAGDFLLDALKDGMEGKITYPELVDPDIRLASLRRRCRYRRGGLCRRYMS